MTIHPSSARPGQRAFQVRMPADLHRQLQAHAERTRFSMNQLVEDGIRKILSDDAGVELSPEIKLGDIREAQATAALAGETSALKGIAKHYASLGLPNLSALLYGLSGEAIANKDTRAASKELTRTASNLLHSHRSLAIALLRNALRHNPDYAVAKSLLGQAYYFDGQLEQAVELLAPVREWDNHARLFHGRASLRLAMNSNDTEALIQAGSEVAAALKSWAFGNRDRRDRLKWLRQVAELDGMNPAFRERVNELLDYANNNAAWEERVTRATLSLNLENAEIVNSVAEPEEQQ